MKKLLIFVFVSCLLLSCSPEDDWCNSAAVQYWSSCTCFARLYNNDSVSVDHCAYITETMFCNPDPDDPEWFDCYLDLREPSAGCEYILPDSCSRVMGW